MTPPFPKKLPFSRFAPSPVLLAVQPLDLKVRVEVEDDALRGLRCRDDPVAVLVRRVLQRITGGGDVTGLAGIQDASTFCRCDRDRGEETEGWGKAGGNGYWSEIRQNIVNMAAFLHLSFGWKVAGRSHKSPVNGTLPRRMTQRTLLHLPCCLCMKMWWATNEQ